MEDGSGGGEGSTSTGRFPILQANRDPESNWEVDVAKSLEEYLLKICSGEISGEDGAHNFNFAEGALVCRVSCGECVGSSFAGCAPCQDLWEVGNWEGGKFDFLVSFLVDGGSNMWNCAISFFF